MHEKLDKIIYKEGIIDFLNANFWLDLKYCKMAADLPKEFDLIVLGSGSCTALLICLNSSLDI